MKKLRVYNTVTIFQTLFFKPYQIYNRENLVTVLHHPVQIAAQVIALIANVYGLH